MTETYAGWTTIVRSDSTGSVTPPHNTMDRIEAAHTEYIEALQIQFKAQIRLCKAQAALAEANRNVSMALADWQALNMELAHAEYDPSSTPDIGL